MDKDSFLDTNVIIYYINYQKESSTDPISRSYFYISNKKGKFIICHAVIRELYNVMSKFAALHKEVLKKVEDSSYNLEESKSISKRDLLFAQKTYFSYKDCSIKELKELFASQRDIFEIGIEQFLKNKADSQVMPMEQINLELVNKIRNIISNYADCQILASALQYQKDNEIFLFVTADGEHLDPNGYDFLKEHLEINYSKERYQFPQLKNLCFEE